MQPYTPPRRNHISLILGFLARENGLTKINHYANASNLDPASELPAGNFNAPKTGSGFERSHSEVRTFNLGDALGSQRGLLPNGEKFVAR